jgi:acyl carrier protein
MPNTIEWTDFTQKIADYTGMEQSEIHQETNIYNDLGMDSLGLFSLGMYLIKQYKVKIPLTAVATIETVGNIFALMNEQVVEVSD